MWTPEDRMLVGDCGSGQALSDGQYRLLDGLFHVVRTCCQWRHLPPPPAFPPWPTVYGYFRAFLAAGMWEGMRHHLVVMLREGEGREASPTAAIIDTQSVKTTEKGGRARLGRRQTPERAQAPRSGGHGRVAAGRGRARWVVERSLGRLGRWRRLSKDHEALPEVSEAMATLAMIRLTLHRLAHPNRRRPPAP